MTLLSQKSQYDPNQVINSRNTTATPKNFNIITLLSRALKIDVYNLYQAILVIVAGGPLYTVQDSVPLTGNTVTSNGSNLLAINPAGALAALTIIFPSLPKNGQVFTINITQNITSATFTSSSTIQHYSVPAPLGAGSLRYIYDTSQNTWLLN